MSRTVNVSTLKDLYSALAKAEGGETILLAGGNYGDFNLLAKSGFNYKFPENVTIKSADANNPAVFNTVDVRNGANMTFDGITFDYVFKPGTPIWTKPFQFSNCDNITIRNSVFDGDLARGVSPEADGLGYGMGLVMGSSRGSVVENNEFFDFFRGLAMGNGSDARITGNEMHGLRMDGMNFSQMQRIVIEDNYLHDFNRSDLKADHADMIQFWTNGGSRPSTDIVIRGNTLDIGGGDSTQSIFMRNDMVDRGLAGKEMYYQNVLIENNLIINGHANGITVGETNGLIIRNNSVLHSDGGDVDGLDASSEIPKISIAKDSQNVVIENNAVAAIFGNKGQSDWVMKNNAYIQDQSPTSPGYYGDVFISSTLTLTDGRHQFIATPGGMLDVLKAGSPSHHLTGKSVQDFAMFTVSEDADNAAVRVFEAMTVIGESRSFNAVPPVFEWSFSDGTKATGATVNKTYEVGGHDTVTLSMRMSDGTISTQTVTVGIQGPDVLSMDKTGNFHAHAYGIAQQITNDDKAAGLDLGGKTNTVIAREHLYEIFGSDNFSIAMSLQADQPGAKGEVFRMQGTFIAAIEKGELILRAFPDNLSQVTLTTKGANLSDGKLHDLKIEFADQTLSVLINGEVAASASVPSTFGDNTGASFLFGRAGRNDNFDGLLTDFKVSVDEKDFEKAVASKVISEPTNDTSVSGNIPTIVETTPGQAAPQQIHDASYFISTDNPLQMPGNANTTVTDGAVGLVSGGGTVRMATEGDVFKSFSAKDLGLRDEGAHSTIVLLDATTDRLQVISNGQAMPDMDDTDFDIVDSGIREGGWKLAATWGNAMEDTITDIELGDRFEFIEPNI